MQCRFFFALLPSVVVLCSATDPKALEQARVQALLNHVLTLNSSPVAYLQARSVSNDRISRIRKQFTPNATMISYPNSGSRPLTLDYLALFFPTYSGNVWWHVDGGGVKSVRKNETHFVIDWMVGFGSVEAVVKAVPPQRFRASARFERGSDRIEWIAYDQVAGLAGAAQIMLSNTFRPAESYFSRSKERLCDEAVSICTDEHCLKEVCPKTKQFPFASYTECTDVMKTVPHRCMDPDTEFTGNSRSCRIMHSLLAEFNPKGHCSHLGLHSDAKCRNKYCPNAAYCRDSHCTEVGYCTEDAEFRMQCTWHTQGSKGYFRIWFQFLNGVLAKIRGLRAETKRLEAYPNLYDLPARQ